MRIVQFALSYCPMYNGKQINQNVFLDFQWQEIIKGARMGKALRLSMLVTDVGFIFYWIIVFLELLPKDYLYKDYGNELMVAWNLSFLPLDLFISFTGLASILLFRKGRRIWSSYCVISLSLTFCSGLQAIVFWAIRQDFDAMWWVPNLALLIYPLIFLPRLIKHNTGSPTLREVK